MFADMHKALYVEGAARLEGCDTGPCLNWEARNNTCVSKVKGATLHGVLDADVR